MNSRLKSSSVADRRRSGNAGRGGHAGQVGPGGRRRGEAAHRKQALVVEDDVQEVPGPVPRQRAQPAEIHEHGAVAVEHDDLHFRPRQRDAEPERGRQAHRVLEVEEVGPVPDRLQLGRDRAHDRDHDRLLQLGIDRLERLEPLHASSHIRSRQRSSATGRFDGVGQRHPLLDPLRDVGRMLQARRGNPERAEQIFGDEAALGLPRIPLAEIAPAG